MHTVLWIKRGTANSPSLSCIPSGMYFHWVQSQNSPHQLHYSLSLPHTCASCFSPAHWLNFRKWKAQIARTPLKGLMNEFLYLPLNWFFLLTSQFLMTAPHCQAENSTPPSPSLFLSTFQLLNSSSAQFPFVSILTATYMIQALVTSHLDFYDRLLWHRAGLSPILVSLPLD